MNNKAEEPSIGLKIKVDLEYLLAALLLTSFIWVPLILLWMHFCARHPRLWTTAISLIFG
ncbi:MAG: hypothetical protein PHS95_01770 [Candidatus Pacebacteria bacterium]|nr:hypothetical protein [Candidatus Paceibacterota bacterium]